MSGAEHEQPTPTPVQLQEYDEEDEEQNPGAFMWIEGDSLAPPCQSDRDVVAKIVDIAQLSPNDMLFDLGCGDGRICIAAALQHGCRARGVEIEEFLIDRFRHLVAANKLQERVSVSHGDLMTEDLSSATVVVTYLLPEAMDALADKLKALLADKQRGVRVICNTWGIPGLTPTARYDVGDYGNVTLLVYKSNP